MPSPVSLWTQRLPEDAERRLERAEATAREDMVETHARLACDLVDILAPRMPFDDAIERYLESMNLEGDDAEAVGTRAVTLIGMKELNDDMAREGHRGWGFDWRYATPLGALRLIQRHRKRSAEEHLWLELAAARAEEKLADEHVRHAFVFLDILDEHVDPTTAVELYVERLRLPEIRARLVYQRVLAQLAESHLPRLNEDEEAPASPNAVAPAAPPVAPAAAAEAQRPA